MRELCSTWRRSAADGRGGGGHGGESEPRTTHDRMTDQEPADRFDTELLIDEVEKRPPIWDMSCADYKDRVVKKRCWEEIVDIFCNGDTQEKKTVGE